MKTLRTIIAAAVVTTCLSASLEAQAISALPGAESIAAEDVLVGVQGGVTKKFPFSLMLGKFVLLAGDDDGQTIQGVTGNEKPRLNMNNTELDLYGDGASPAHFSIEGGYINLATPDNFSSIYIGNLDASIRVSTDGTSETRTFLNVSDTGLEFDVHDGLAQFQMTDDGTMFTGARFRLNGMAVPATATDACFTGSIAWDSGFVYVCIATDTWKRFALSTW